MEIAINNANLHGSRYNAYYLNYGYYPSFLLDVYETARKTDVHGEQPKEFIERLLLDAENFHAIIQQVNSRMKNTADAHRTPTSFQIGDLVLVNFHKRAHMSNQTRSKLLPRFEGPYRILRIINPSTYEIDIPLHGRASRIFHTSYLKPFIPTDTASNASVPTDSTSSSTQSSRPMTTGLGIPLPISQTEPATSQHIDYLSTDKNSDINDVKLDPIIFRHACRQLRFKPRADVFATRHHRQLKYYCSPRHRDQSHKYCIADDAFSIKWNRKDLPIYANPPWFEIPRVLDKIIQDKARVMLVCPLWPRADWFDDWKALVTDYVIYDEPIYLDGRNRLRPAPQWSTAIALVDARKTTA
jgi:hypothetical protein